MTLLPPPHDSHKYNAARIWYFFKDSYVSLTGLERSDLQWSDPLPLPPSFGRWASIPVPSLAFFFFSFSGSCCVQFGWVSNRQRSSRLSLRGETMAGVCRSHPAGYPEQARVLKLADTSVWCHPPPLTFLPLPGKWMLSRKRGQIWVKTSDENPSFPRLQL